MRCPSFPATFASLGAFLVLAAPVVAAATSESAPASITTEQLAGTVLSITPRIAYESAMLRVFGPEGYVLSRTFESGGPITVDLLAEAQPPLGPLQRTDAGDARDPQPWTALPDGSYHYELVLSSADGRATNTGGAFSVEGGAPIGREVDESPSSSPREGPVHVSGSELGGAIPVSEDEELARLGGGSFDEYVSIHDANGDGHTELVLFGDEPDPNYWILANTGFDGFRIFEPEQLPDGGIFLRDRLSIRPGFKLVGIGTHAPSSHLDVHNRTDDVNELTLSNANGTGHVLHSDVNGHFAIRPWLSSEVPFIIWEGAPNLSLNLSADGIGLGTTTPAADLDVRDLDGNDVTNLRLTRGGETWAMSQAPNGVLGFNKLTTGGRELVVRQRHHPVATLGVQGPVQATEYKTVSSKTVKTAFEAVDPAMVLMRLAALPIQKWRYKTESAGERHVGAFAEDFQRLFGLGDGKTISTVDADGILMAAVQGLLQKMNDALATKDAEIAELRAELVAVREALRDR